MIEHIAYRPGVLRLLDQTQLPDATIFLELRTLPEVAGAIKALQVRGAPAIGIAAAYAMAIKAHELADHELDPEAYFSRLDQAAAGLIAVRPTAVNLAWAVHRQLGVARSQIAAGASGPVVAAALDKTAQGIHSEDVSACHRIADAGAAYLLQCSSRSLDRLKRSSRPLGRLTILTHCNTGDLATGGYGTALGIIRSLWKEKKLERVFVDETRPVLQGARLTAWELTQEGIPYTLITDSMAAHFMQRKDIDAVVVGADRIACNGDVANKIGTYNLAIAANAHQLPFVVAAPLSTFDPAIRSGGDIAIEERNPQEVTGFLGVRAAPADAVAANPAFDITPAHYISAIVSDRGVLEPPLDEAIAMLAHSTVGKVDVAR
jgi:methylthioribose-1-phosphate isomerase